MCREISVEKLNLGSDSPPKAEIRRDVVDAAAPLVSQRNGGQRGREADERMEKMGSLTLSCYYSAHFLPAASGLETVL